MLGYLHICPGRASALTVCTRVKAEEEVRYSSLALALQRRIVVESTFWHKRVSIGAESSLNYMDNLQLSCKIDSR